MKKLSMNELAYTLRKLSQNDEAILYAMLYHAVFVPKGDTPPARDIVDSPELTKYIVGFGKTGDMGYAAFVEEKVVGAAWLRQLRGYGYVDDETPELTVAVIPECRGSGLGTVLLEHLFESAKAKYQHVSLSVWRINPAFRLYQRFGFEVVRDLQDEVVMLKKL
jgi:ribosomal protein S18 acetylase RimI-like enzyme